MKNSINLSSYLLFATLCIGCANSSTSEDQTPQNDSIMEATIEMNDTLPVEASQSESDEVVSSQDTKRIKIEVVNLDEDAYRVWTGTIGNKKVTLVLNGNDWSGIDGGYFFYDRSPKQYYALRMIHYGEEVNGFGQSTDLKFDAYSLDGTKIGEFEGSLNVSVEEPPIEEWNFSGTFRDVQTGKTSNVDVSGEELV